MTALTEKRALKLAEVAELYSVSERTVYRAVRAGDLRAKKNGRGYLVSAEAAADWFEGLPDG